VGAIPAKEVFVAQMGIVFAVGEADETSDQLRAQLRDRYSPLIGFCIMLFALISTPCIATFAITRQEAGSIKWAFAQSFGLTALAWIVTFAVYQGGLLLGLGVG
jgi:ferrous iron transport protein B